jgi:hypothetical protein
VFRQRKPMTWRPGVRGGGGSHRSQGVRAAPGVPSVFSDGLVYTPSAREVSDARLTEKIMAIHAASVGRPGFLTRRARRRVTRPTQAVQQVGVGAGPGRVTEQPAQTFAA